jgi:hypothetical protein
MPEEMPIDRRFVFSGSAVAFGGRIRRPDDLFLKAAAPAYLPVTGGLSEAKVEGTDAAAYHYKDYLKFSAAYSRALGDYSDPRKAADFTHGNQGQNQLPVHTIVETQLLDLQIDAAPDPVANTPRRIFYAKKLDLHVESAKNWSTEASTLLSLSVAFDGLSLTSGGPDSAPVSLHVQTATQIFCDNDTKAKLVDRYAKDGDFRKRYAACFYPLLEAEKGFLSNFVGGSKDIPNAEKGPIVATFVTKLEFTGAAVPTGVEILNNRLTIPGLGRIYFGEIIIGDSYQRASLLRFELGSGVGASGTACEASSNGVHLPPLS